MIGDDEKGTIRVDATRLSVKLQPHRVLSEHCFRQKGGRRPYAWATIDKISSENGKTNSCNAVFKARGDTFQTRHNVSYFTAKHLKAMAHTLQLDRPLAFFDLETTGISIATDRIVEIAIVK